MGGALELGAEPEVTPKACGWACPRGSGRRLGRGLRVVGVAYGLGAWLRAGGGAWGHPKGLLGGGISGQGAGPMAWGRGLGVVGGACGVGAGLEV